MLVTDGYPVQIGAGLQISAIKAEIVRARSNQFRFVMHQGTKDIIDE